MKRHLIVRTGIMKERFRNSSVPAILWKSLFNVCSPVFKVFSPISRLPGIKPGVYLAGVTGNQGGGNRFFNLIHVKY